MKRLNWSISGVLLIVLCFAPLLAAQKATMRITVDNGIKELYINEESIKLGPEAKDWTQASVVEFEVKPRGGNLIAVHCEDWGVIAGLLADITYDKTEIVTDTNWKYSTKPEADWWKIKFDDKGWKNAVEYGQYPCCIWGGRVNGMNKPQSKALWIWSENNVQGGKIDTPVFFRYSFGEMAVEPAFKLSITWGRIKRK